MSTDKIGLVKIVLGCGADSAVTVTKGLNAIGVLPSAVPDTLQKLKEYVFSPIENTPDNLDDIVNTLRVLKERHPDIYDQLRELVTQKR